MAAHDTAISHPAQRFYTAGVDISGLPGEELVRKGLADLRHGLESDEAWLVLIGAPRLRRAGIVVPDAPTSWCTNASDPLPEHSLYERLARTEPRTARSRYNALIRRLVSFERAAERRRSSATFGA